MYDSRGNELSRWNFEKVLPVKWTGPTLKSDQGAVAIETLELIVHDFSS
jgi:phage tail-like protein